MVATLTRRSGDLDVAGEAVAEAFATAVRRWPADLTLRMTAGVTVPGIARAFLMQETSMAQRITRAKARIKAARIPYRVPSAKDLPARARGVPAVLFLVFNEGYLAAGPGTDPVRHDLNTQAAYGEPETPTTATGSGCAVPNRAIELLTPYRGPYQAAIA